jgi:hypothetical protein
MRAGLHLKVGRITLARRTQHGACAKIPFSWLGLAAALAFEPFQHVGITSHGKLLLDGQVLLAALRTLPVFALRRG